MTSLARPDDREARTPAVPPVVDIVVPVFNEAHVLATNIGRLRTYLDAGFPSSWRITIVDNASTDGTWSEASKLASLYDDVDALHLDEKGRGGALRAAWSRSDATVVAYTDVDLSTDLRALVPMVAALVSGHSDIAIGSRLAPGAQVARGTKREFVSRTYNRLLHVVFHNRFRDAQCGFKAVRADVARRLLPEIADDGWFFDTELLLLAEHNGLRIAEIAVDWTDDPDSRVHVARTAIDDLKGMVRVARAFWRGRGYVHLDGIGREPIPAATGGEVLTFAGVGAVSTAAYFVLFAVLLGPVGPYAANAAALTATMLANTGVHRRFTFGRRGHGGRAREWARAAVVHTAGLCITTAAIAGALAVDGGSVASYGVLLLVASSVSTALRFLLMPVFVFRKSAR
jgi:putative flippase GtrA